MSKQISDMQQRDTTRHGNAEEPRASNLRSVPDEDAYLCHLVVPRTDLHHDQRRLHATHYHPWDAAPGAMRTLLLIGSCEDHFGSTEAADLGAIVIRRALRYVRLVCSAFHEHVVSEDLLRHLS